MNSERTGDPGIGPTTSGPGDHSNGTEDQTSRSSNAGPGSGSDDRNRRRPKSASEQRVRWIGIASAVATMVFLLAQMYGTLTGNTEIQKDIQNKIPTSDQIEQLGDAIGDVQTSVEDIPPPTETTIIQKGEAGAPGQPGQPGQPGAVKIVRTAPNTVIVTTSAPVPPSKSNPPSATKPDPPTPKPTCATSLFGACIIP